MKNGLKDQSGNYIPVRYSAGSRYDRTQGPESIRNAVTIYAKEYTPKLPAELSPKNDSDSMTDYFEKDHATFFEGSPEYDTLILSTKANHEMP